MEAKDFNEIVARLTRLETGYGRLADGYSRLDQRVNDTNERMTQMHSVFGQLLRINEDQSRKLDVAAQRTEEINGLVKWANERKDTEKYIWRTLLGSLVAGALLGLVWIIRKMGTMP